MPRYKEMSGGVVPVECLYELEDAQTEIARLQHLLFLVALAVSDPDRDHVDRCALVGSIVGSAEQWR